MLSNSTSRKVFSFFLCFFLFIAAFSSLQPVRVQSLPKDAYVNTSGDYLTIGNSLIELKFRKDNGGIWSIKHKESNIDLRSASRGEYPVIWEIDSLLTENLQHYGTDSWMSEEFFSYSYRSIQNRTELTLSWSKIRLWNDKGLYDAKVNVDIVIYDYSPLTRWRISITNSGPHQIERVVFPLISGVGKLGNSGEDDILVVPEENGRAFSNPQKNLEHWGNTYPSGFTNMQFFACYDDEGGFYFATYDKDCFPKTFWYSKETSSWSTIGIQHFHPIDFGSDFTMDYDVIIGVFTGDWTTAADIYKEWAHQQWWCEKTISEKTPEWVQEIAIEKIISLFDRSYKNFDYTDCLSLTRLHLMYFDLNTLIRLWGWEHGGTWAYGDYFPPQKGWSKFDDVVEKLHDEGTHVSCYIGALGVVSQSPLWNDSETALFSIKDENEEQRIDIVPGTAWEETFFCPYTAFWREKIIEYTSILATHNIDLIELDGFPTTPPIPCYDESHEHSLGFGWYTEAWIQILEEIRSEAKKINPNIALKTEDGAEVFIPYIDIFDSTDSWAENSDESLQNDYSSIIPLFSYVYHNYILLSDTHALALWTSLKGESYNRLGFARILITGEIPSYNLLETLTSMYADKKTLDYVKKIGQARSTYANDFLIDSKMRKSTKIESPIITVKDEDGHSFNTKALQFSAWESNKGHIGYIITNISEDLVEIDQIIESPVTPPYNVYLLRDGAFEWSDFSNNKTYHLNLSINPLEIDLLVFLPQDTKAPTADAGFDQTIPIDTEFTFNATQSSDNSMIIKYEWDFGDGEFGNEIVATHVYSNPGTYNVTLTVEDIAGNVGSNSILITAESEAPMIPGFPMETIILGLFFVTLFIFFRKRNSCIHIN